MRWITVTFVMGVAVLAWGLCGVLLGGGGTDGPDPDQDLCSGETTNVCGPSCVILNNDEDCGGEVGHQYLNTEIQGEGSGDQHLSHYEYLDCYHYFNCIQYGGAVNGPCVPSQQNPAQQICDDTNEDTCTQCYAESTQRTAQMSSACYTDITEE